MTPEQRQQFTANAGAGLRGGDGQRLGGAGAGLVSGEIISKDDTSITIKMRSGGSKIVFYSSTTEIGKFTRGSLADLNIGETVTATGSTNSDGSVTAQSIQMRPIPTALPGN